MRRDDKVGLLISVLGPRETQTGINVEVAGLGCWQTCDDTSAGSSQQRRLPAFAAFTLPNMAAIVAWETQRCGTGIAGGTLGERVAFGRMGVTETPAVVFSVQISMRGFSASRSGTGYRKLCRKFASFSEPHSAVSPRRPIVFQVREHERIASTLNFIGKVFPDS